MTESEFVKEIIFLKNRKIMSLLVMNELLGVALLLLGIGAVSPLIIGLLAGKEQNLGFIGEVFDYIGFSRVDNYKLMCFLVVIFLLKVLLDCVRLYLSGIIGVKLNRDIKLSMNEILSKINWEAFSSINQGRYIQCMISESSLARGAVNDLASTVAYGLVCFLLLIWLAINSFDFFLIFTLFSVLFIFSNRYFADILHKTSRKRIDLMSVMNENVIDMKNIFKILLSENTVSFMCLKIKGLIDEVASVEKTQLLFSIVVEKYVMVFSFLMIFSFAFIHLFVIEGSGSELVFNFILLQQIGSNFSAFQSKRKSMIQKIPSYAACQDILNLKLKFKENFEHTTQKVKLKSSLYFSEISYAHKNGGWLIKNVSLRMQNKGMVFIVGASGSGKTTLMDLMIGLLESDVQGDIFIDEEPLTKKEKINWANTLAYVAQDAYIPTGTLREYLTFGLQDVTEEEIWSALENVHASDIVKNQEKGLNTFIQSGGKNFSGGERQRLSIARALIRKPTILFLDEPSSALDSISEEILFSSLRDISRNILVIIITHSKDIIKETDAVFEISNGRLARG